MKKTLKTPVLCLLLITAFTLSSYIAEARVVTESWQTQAPPLNGLPCTYYNEVKFYWAGEPFESDLLQVTQTRIRNCTQALIVETDLNPIYNSENEIIGFEVNTGTCIDHDAGDGIDGCSDLASSENLDAVYTSYLAQE